MGLIETYLSPYTNKSLETNTLLVANQTTPKNATKDQLISTIAITSIYIYQLSNTRFQQTIQGIPQHIVNLNALARYTTQTAYITE